MFPSLPLPDIVIRADDHARVLHLAAGARERLPYVSAYLQRELNRAEIVQPWERGGVSMGHNVLFRLDDEPQVRIGRLAYPNRPWGERGNVTILGPVGAALIGMHVDSTIEWIDGGRVRTLTVLDYGF
ncbi:MULTISPECIES: nucleoside diphosphate kinase regulator [unclassified Devosia]|uniref:nucleoside diphosphate kinase regulator n=1 Tax=unclassified Devosia TaxID=196773 RepID=UPI001ACF31CC|nr:MULTISPECIES: nucleoside diphosphate kinase regulator [unclassified Devosia]MBN9307120.1 nucleoside diphosphate kinase regulator [Devosia sp.]